jgi:hypothetical protein
MIREGWINTIESTANAAARGYAWWFFISGFNTCILGLVLFHYIRTTDGSSHPAPVLFALLSILLSILGILVQPEMGWWLLTLEALYVLYANYCYQCPSQTSQKKNK